MESGASSQLPDGYSPDALLEAARDRAQESASQFSKRLAAELYRDIRADLGFSWPRASRLLAARVPGTGVTTGSWPWLVDLIRTTYPHLTGHPAIVVHPADDASGLGLGVVIVIEDDSGPELRVLWAYSDDGVPFAELMKIVEGIK